MGRLVSDGLEGTALVEYWERRAGRPMVLRPWNAECLTLRAADDRIAGRGLVVPREVQGADGCRRWEVDHVAPRTIGGPSAAEAEGIGLWRVLETVRREGAITKRQRPGGHRSTSSRQARPTPTNGKGERRVVSVELVRVTGAVMARSCCWPRLPRKCSVSRAAELLGVSRDVVRLWIRSGKLEACCVRDRGVGAIHSVRYPQNGLMRRLATGLDERRPEQYESLSGAMADADWAAARFRCEGRAVWVVRVGKPVTVRPRMGRGVRRYWLCPVCGRQVARLYLPAGPLARGGRTWAAWRWQCRRCTGVVNEAGIVAGGGSDNLNLWLLKSTCGQLGGNEWRKYLGTAGSGL